MDGRQVLEGSNVPKGLSEEVVGDYPVVAGGQGRSAAEITQSAVICAGAFGFGVGAIIVAALVWLVRS